jgi:P-type Ca2+ transporter type 2C
LLESNSTTCSIVYEIEPFDPRLMQQPPRKATSSFFQWHELRISIIQGVIISLVLLVAYSIAVFDGAEESLTRTVVFSTLIFANAFLTLANRSFSESFLKTIQKKNKLMNIVILISLALLALVLYLPRLQNIFQLVPLSALQLLQCICADFLSVIWIEGYKLLLRKKESLLTNGVRYHEAG